MIVLVVLFGPLPLGGFGPVVLRPLLASDLLIAALLVGSVTLLVGLPLLGPLEIGLGLLLLLPGVPDPNDLPTAAATDHIIITYSVCLFFGWLLILWDLFS